MPANPLRISRRIPQHLPWLALAALLSLVWTLYYPGLSGGFLFDDFVNLPPLGATGPVDNWAAFWRYLTSGTADPTGRPLALLSFLLDARDWPANPAPFLRTNVLLHLLNATLLFALLRTLGRRLDAINPNVVQNAAKDLPYGETGLPRNSRSFAALRTTNMRTDAAALLGTALWALHPLFVSTTLYIVQREAMLPATFVLGGLLTWLHGRQRLSVAPRAGVAWMVLGIGLGTGLAILSKANGALLPLLAWVLEATVLRQQAATVDHNAARHLHRLRFVLLVLPSLAVLAYLLARLAHLGALSSRPWTLGERLLTEPRVMLDYLHLLVIPRVLSTGLYNDAYVFSTGLLDPVVTLPALLAVLALVVAGFALRRRTPTLAAALLFFFGGHLMESTTIPLELYFEHRNYLPAMLIGWPLARAICRWQAPVWIRSLAAAMLLSLLSATTWQRASLWADQDQMALLWAAQNPASSRAQVTAASFEVEGHHADLAMARLAGPWRKHPDDLQLALNYVSAACLVRGLHGDEVDAVNVTLHTASTGDQLLYRWLKRALDAAVHRQCPGMDLPVVARWIDAARTNPSLADEPGRQQDLHSLAGRLALARGDHATALAQFNAALDAWPTPQAVAMQSALLASNNAYADGLAHLDHYAAIEAHRKRATGINMQRIHAWVLEEQGFWQNELSRLRRNIQADLRQAGNKTSTRADTGKAVRDHDGPWQAMPLVPTNPSSME